MDNLLNYTFYTNKTKVILIKSVHSICGKLVDKIWITFCLFQLSKYISTNKKIAIESDSFELTSSPNIMKLILVSPQHENIITQKERASCGKLALKGRFLAGLVAETAEFIAGEISSQTK